MKHVIAALADLVAVIPGAAYVTISAGPERAVVSVACATDEAANALAAALHLVQPTLVNSYRTGSCWLASDSNGELGPTIHVTGPHRPIAPRVDPAASDAAVAKARQAIAIVHDAEIES